MEVTNETKQITWRMVPFEGKLRLSKKMQFLAILFKIMEYYNDK